MRPIQAVIFDMDGVLVDSEPVHRVASRRLVHPHPMTDEEYERFIGASMESFVAWIRQHYRIESSAEDLTARYSGFIVEALVASPPPPLDGVMALLDRLRAQGLPLAVASQSQPEWVRETLVGSGLDRWFDVVVSADAVHRPKPDPDIYLHTAGRLAVPAEACLAVEDSVPGVAAAAAAGMLVVQSRQASLPSRPQPGARFVVESLRDFDLAWLG